LYGVPFDPARLELLGTPARVLDDVAGDASRGGGQFDFSSSPTGPGTFVYLRGKLGDEIWPVDWLESSGKTEPLIATAERYFNPRVSPDGERLAVSLSSGKGTDIFVYDRRRDTRTRLTFTAQENFFPVWAPDRRHLVFRSQLNSGMWWIRADGAGEAQRVLENKNLRNPYSFSPDGKLLLYEELNSQTGFDLWMLPLDLSDPERPKPGKPEPFLRTPSAERFPAFSPDGRWVAYSAIQSGSFEVYVRSYLAPAAGAPGGKWQISNGGGIHPIWSPKGGELFFQTPDQHIMTVRYTVQGDSFRPEKPRLWSETRILDNGYADWDVAPDGKRLVILPRPEAPAEQKGSVHVTVLLNFFDELRRRVPAGK
jgi:Tol biopolymer transport system component